MVEFYLLTFPRFPLRKKEHKSYLGKNRTHDFRTSRCAGYLLDHSGDTRSDDSEQISPPPITHHTAHKKTRNLQRNYVCRWEKYLYRVGTLSRLVCRPSFEPSLLKGVLPFIIITGKAQMAPFHSRRRHQLPCPRLHLRTWSREPGFTVPSRVSLLILLT